MYVPCFSNLQIMQTLTTEVSWKTRLKWVHVPEREIVEIWNLQCVTASTLLEMNLVNLWKNEIKKNINNDWYLKWLPFFLTL